MVEKIVLILLFGLAWGSFLNVVIFRLPRDMNLSKPPSSCPECETRIKFYDNIPILSFILLKGACRQCRTKIPISYFLVEILIPASFLLLYSKYAFSFFFFASCLFASAMIVLAVIDYYHQILPDEITLSGLALAVVYSFFRADLNLTQALIGAVSGASFLLLVYGAYYLFRKKEGLGMGDVTLMLFVGAFLGWQKSFLTLILGSFVGALIGIYFIFIRKEKLQFALPFGTFLAPAAFIALIWGEKIIRAYLSQFKDLVP
jgi:leader peptidase (prepilin peptidase)/N-methyltransferase